MSRQKPPARPLRTRLAAALALLALLPAGATPAQERDPDNPTCPPNPDWPARDEMRFTVEQVDGRPVLLAEGRIDEAMAPRLEEALKIFRGDEIRLRSPGGDARAAMAAADLIRHYGRVTRIPAGWACASACATMFLGGILRFVDQGGLLSFSPGPDGEAHGGDAPRPTDQVALASARQATEDYAFLTRMGVSHRLLTEIVYARPAGADAGHRAARRCLTPEEMQQYNVVNGGYRPTQQHEAGQDGERPK